MVPPAKPTLQSSLVNVWPEKPLIAEKSLNFLLPWCILHNLVHLGGNSEWLIFPGKLQSNEFWYCLVLSLEQSLVSPWYIQNWLTFLDMIHWISFVFTNHSRWARNRFWNRLMRAFLYDNSGSGRLPCVYIFRGCRTQWSTFGYAE